MAHIFGSAYRRFKIVEGPPKSEFMISLFAEQAYKTRFTVKFSEERIVICDFWIQSAHAIAGDKNRWLCTGTYRVCGSDGFGTYFSALYDMRTRTGHLELPEKTEVNDSDAGLKKELEKLSQLLSSGKEHTGKKDDPVHDSLVRLHHFVCRALGEIQ